MGAFQRLREKIKAGWLHELAREGRWLWTYIRRYRAAVWLHILLGVLAILMGLGTSVASKYLIDAVTGHKTGAIGGAAGAMAGMLLGNIAMKSVASRVGAVISIRVQNGIQAEVYQHILSAEWEALEQLRSGDLIQRLTGDVGTVAGGVTGLIPSLVSGSVQLLGALAIILFYDPTMAVIALLGVPVSAVCSRVLVERMRGYNKRMKGLSSDVLSFYEDSLSQMTSVKAFDITELFYGKMTALQQRYREEYLLYNRFSVGTSALMSLVGMAVSSCCFGWGVYRLWTGAISYGSMTMFLQLASTLRSAFSSLLGLVSSAVSVSTSAGRVMAVMELPTERTGESCDLRREGDVSLTLEQVSFAYRGGETVLDRVSLQARTGDLVALTGPSGEGKTTLLRLLLGLVEPTEGSAVLRWGGGELPLSAATRSAFAYVPQGNSLFAGTIAEDLRMVKPEATEEELEQVLRVVCAYDFVQELPGGLQYTVGNRGRGLSEGQAQRLAVARALLRGAPVLLLDEATSALDEATEERLLRSLMDSGLVRTCIFVTHRPGTMRFCTRQYRVENGRITPVERETD